MKSQQSLAEWVDAFRFSDDLEILESLFQAQSAEELLSVAKAPKKGITQAVEAPTALKARLMELEADNVKMARYIEELLSHIQLLESRLNRAA